MHDAVPILPSDTSEEEEHGKAKGLKVVVGGYPLIHGVSWDVIKQIHPHHRINEHGEDDEGSNVKNGGEGEE